MSKWRNKDKKQAVAEQPAEPVQTETQVETAEPVTETKADPASNNFAEAAEKIEQAGGDPVAPVEPVTSKNRGVIPDQFGNNVKGERICRNCGVKESETLAKNPRYSFCKGLCVNCYGKLERKSVKPSELTVQQLEEKVAYYKDLLQKKLNGAQGLTEGNAIENTEANTAHVTIESHGASVDVKVEPTEQLATIEN